MTLRATALPSPIFKPHLLRLVYARTKTQTRRVIARQPADLTAMTLMLSDGVRFATEAAFVRFPYGAAGQHWYLREGVMRANDHWSAYRLDDLLVCGHLDGRWRWQRATLPSIHLPRAIARHFARISDVRVERVQDLSEADAVAEGAMDLGDDWVAKHFPTYQAQRDAWWSHGCHGEPPTPPTARERFRALWNDINAARGFAWEDNPFVWVYDFRLLTRDEALAA